MIIISQIRILNNNSSEVKRDIPLDLLRGFAFLLVLPAHVLLQLNDVPSIWNWDNMLFFSFCNMAPGMFFCISGFSVGYIQYQDKKIKKSLIKSFFLIICGIVLLIYGMMINYVLHDPLIFIGLSNLILISISLVFKNKFKTQIFVISTILSIMIILKILLNFEFPFMFHWPFSTWFLLPFSSYIICLIVPNKISYNNYRLTFKSNKRSILFFIICLSFTLTLVFFYPPQTDDTHNLFYVLFSFALSLTMYGLFGLIFPIIRNIDIIKIYSKYAIEIWIFHFIIIFLLKALNVKFFDLFTYLLITIPLILFNYLIFKIVDKTRKVSRNKV